MVGSAWSSISFSNLLWYTDDILFISSAYIASPWIIDANITSSLFDRLVWLNTYSLKLYIYWLTIILITSDSVYVFKNI